MMKDINHKAALEWALSRNVGASSKALVRTALGLKSDGSYPHDGGDFGRCEVAMNMIPGLRERLPMMAEVNTYWAALVPAWEEIKAAKDQYAAIQSIIRPRENQDSSIVRVSSNLSIRFSPTT